MTRLMRLCRLTLASSERLLDPPVALAAAKRLLVSVIVLSAGATTAMAQPRAVDFQLQKITTNFISPPQFTYTGAEQFQADQRERWLEVEVTFASTPEFTDELT